MLMLSTMLMLHDWPTCNAKRTQVELAIVSAPTPVGVRRSFLRLMYQTEFQQHIGPKIMCASFADELNRAAELQGEMTDPEFRETKLSKTSG
jgi:hypothetical protein